MLVPHSLITLALSCSLVAAQAWLRAPREVAPQVGDHIRAFADFDRDGNLDVLVTRERGNIAGIASMWIAFGTVDGDYVPGPTIAALPQGYQAETYALAGDVTGDGLPDVVTSLRELTGTPGNGFLLYRNTGGGTLAAPVHTRTSGIPWESGVLSDWNRDGVLELVEVHIGATGFGAVQRWTYQNGVFFGSNEAPAPTYLGLLAIGEVTGDGVTDVVAGSADTNQVFVAPTLAGGGLGPMVAYSVGTSTTLWGRSPACGDLDGDGDDDIVVGWPRDSFSSSIVVITNHGAGGLAVGAEQPIAARPGSYWQGQPHIVDWDGDGDGDILLSHEQLQVLENRGAAGWQLAGSIRVANHPPQTGTRDGNDGVGAADFNGDGHLDFATGRVLVLGTGQIENHYFAAIFSSVQQPLDFDGDGDLDILESGGTLRTNVGGSVFLPAQATFPTPPPTFTYVEAHACGDFTGDGQLDLLVTYHQYQFPQLVFLGMHLLEGHADGRFGDGGLAGPAATRVGTSATFSVVQHDLDGDGDVDIATTDGYWENQSGRFSVFHPTWTGHPVVVADVDGDRRADVLTLASGATATTYGLARNQGGTFVNEVLATGPSGTFSSQSRGQLVDLDDDGDLDFAIGQATGPALLLRANQGGVFAAAVTLPTRGLAFETLLVDDFDRDGRSDLAALPASGFGDVAHVWRRTGAGLTYAAPRAYLSEGVFAQADLDGDGDPDLYGRYGFVQSGRYAGTSAGSFAQYGSSQAGGSGIAPVLGLAGPARAGGNIELRLRRGEGGGFALFVLGTAAVEVPDIPLPGLTLRVAPISVVLPLTLLGNTGVPGAGYLHIPLTLPLSVRGFSVYHQAFFVEGLTFAASNGLEIVYDR